MVLPHDNDPRLAAPRSRSEPTVTAAGAAGGQPAAAEGQPAVRGEAAAAAAAGLCGGGSAATGAPVPEGAAAASHAPDGTGAGEAGAAGSSFAEAARQLAKRESVPAMVEGMLPQVRWVRGLSGGMQACCRRDHLLVRWMAAGLLWHASIQPPTDWQVVHMCVVAAPGCLAIPLPHLRAQHAACNRMDSRAVRPGQPAMRHLAAMQLTVHCAAAWLNSCSRCRAVLPTLRPSLWSMWRARALGKTCSRVHPGSAAL